MLSGYQGFVHWKEPFLDVMLKGRATVAIFVFLDQGVSNIRTLVCSLLQIVAVLKLSAGEVLYYNRELFLLIFFVRHHALMRLT